MLFLRHPNSATNTQPHLETMPILHHQEPPSPSSSFLNCRYSINLILLADIQRLSGSCAFLSIFVSSSEANWCRFHEATTVGVTEVENAFRVHLFVSRRTRVDDEPPDRSTSGFLVVVVEEVVVIAELVVVAFGAGSNNMSQTPSPFAKTGIDHKHLALNSLIQQRRRRFPPCFFDGIDHNRTVP